MTVEDPQGPFVLCYDGPLLPADRRTAELIAATAEELDAPAIVMGQRGLSGLKSAVLGSVSRDVANTYHRPVIVV
jgi:nucleotide-binding universal stress UspA family protein